MHEIYVIAQFLGFELHLISRTEETAFTFDARKAIYASELHRILKELL